MTRLLLKARVSMSGIIAALWMVALTPSAMAAPYLYVVNTNSVSVINTATNTVVGTVTLPSGSGPIGVAVSPDGSHVYVANNASSTVSVINTATNTVVANVPVGGGPWAIAVSPDGSRVYVANSSSYTVSVINTATNQVVDTVSLPSGSSPEGVAVSPDGSRVYVLNSASDTVSVINTATNQVVDTVPVGDSPISIAVSPDGSRLYVLNSASDTVSVINTATNQVVDTVPVSTFDFLTSVAVSPDGGRIYVANNSTGTVSVINTATNQVVGSPVTVGGGPWGIAVSPDGSRVYVANSSSNTVSVINTATNQVVDTVTLPSGSGPEGVAVSPGALTASNSSASGSAGEQISATVPALSNGTSCATTDAVVQGARHGSVNFDSNTGAYTYTPASATYSGPDSFTWLGQAVLVCSAAYSPTLPASNTAAVTLTINPRFTGLGSVTLGEDKSSSDAFTLTGSTPFTHTLTSDNAAVLAPASVTVAPAACGTAGNLSCTLDLTAASAPGTASVTVTATDKYGDTIHKTLQVTVAAPPTLSGLSAMSVTAGQTGSESFTDTGTGTLAVTASSSNTTVLPNSGITGQSTCTQAGGCTLTLHPAANQSGTSTVTVRVGDAYGQSSTSSFNVTVQASGTGGSGSSGPGSSGSTSGGGGALSMLTLLGLAGLIGLVSLKRRRSGRR